MHSSPSRAALAGIVGLLLPLAAQAAFTDTVGHRYADAIRFVQSEGMVRGYDDETYRPDQPINRAEFVKIMVEAVADAQTIRNCLTQQRAAALPPLRDVPADQWFAPYVCTAREELGIISGYPDGTFRPADPINFAEAAKIVATAYSLPIGTGGEVWYEPFLRALADTDIVLAPRPQPGDRLTRGEMAAMIAGIAPGDNGGAQRPACVVAGCSRQLCIEEGEPGFTTCEYRPEYGCYQEHGLCERQANGQCGWTTTEELRQCLQSASSGTGSLPQ